MGFAFDTNPTLTNARIADAINRAAKMFGEPVLAQIFIPLDPSIQHVERVEETEDLWASTLGVARQTVRWAQCHNLKNLLIFGASAHVSRCERDIRIAAAEKKFTLGDVQVISVEPIWSPCAQQKHVRTEEAWSKRERFIERLPVWLYKIIAA